MTPWHNNQPIYLQLRHLVVRQIVQGELIEGQALPSVRQVAADERINPLTVSRAYQLLVEEGLIEKRRGLGMFVLPNAQTLALSQERKRFVDDEWPQIAQRIEELGLSSNDLLAPIKDKKG